METTFSIAENVPKVTKGKRTTVARSLAVDSTVLLINIPFVKKESGYTDEQFHADLRNAGGWIDAMGEAALKEHAEGKTRKFPE